MPRKLKIALSGLFVLAVIFIVAKGCWHHKAKKVPPPPAPVKRISVPAPPVPAAAYAPRMAIILDDWGNNYALLKVAGDIHQPLTLSVLPHLPQSRRIAEDAKKMGLGVILHMPMEPKGKSQPLEPHTLMTTMSDQNIVQYLDSAIRSVPGVEGMNNHQGSAATSDRRVMRTVMAELKKRGLFFVDSEVISTSVGARTAGEMGVPFAKRDVFLDNRPALEAVKTELRRAEDIALRRSRVVCIGHDKKATLEAIREMVPEFDEKGIQLVLVKDLLES